MVVVPDLQTQILLSKILKEAPLRRYWEQLLHGMPGLWCTGFSNYTPQVQATMHLQRAQNLPLSLVRACMARIRVLYLNVDFPSGLHTLVGLPASRLEVLLLHSDAPSHLGYEPSTMTLCNGDFPQLRYLSIMQCPIRPAAAFPALTHLHLAHQCMGPLPELLQFLAGAPRLVQLTLSFLRVSSPAAKIDAPKDATPRKVYLDHLRSLCLTDIAPDIVLLLLAYLVIPASPVAIQLAHIRKATPAFFRALPDLPALRGATRLSVEARRGSLVVAGAGATSAVRMHFVDVAGPGSLVPEWLDALLDVLPAGACCRELWWTDWHRPGAAPWTYGLHRTLERMWAVSALVLCEPPMRCKRQGALFDGLFGVDGGASGCAMLPALRTLHLVTHRFAIPARTNEYAKTRACRGRPLTRVVVQVAVDELDSDDVPDEDLRAGPLGLLDASLDELQETVGVVELRVDHCTPSMPLPLVCHDPFVYWESAGMPRPWFQLARGFFD
ncbi:predicted protein [Postia placenta Mad-698-R]|nr:predicted protein [Postia placenta Mad-698-R]